MHTGYGNSRYTAMDKPVEQGKEYVGTVREISRHGDGVVNIRGFVVFVPNTKVGQEVRFRVVDVKARCAVGELAPGGAQ